LSVTGCISENSKNTFREKSRKIKDIISDYTGRAYMRASQRKGKIGDDTQLKRKIEELEELNHDLMGMIENTHDALCIVDGESRLLSK